ncbi:hypothetical protein CRG98_046978 [Punica granatum]|uniref:Uncharacterized protein n=1 Tax=Punica granatum TaxID=22663 RepID=A0A2I0HLU2_PUNGR|nr:hypothetical protein CRG98_046978 [Punica granatum]
MKNVENPILWKESYSTPNFSRDQSPQHSGPLPAVYLAVSLVKALVNAHHRAAPMAEAVSGPGGGDDSDGTSDTGGEGIGGPREPQPG